jgi:hypothetical protein
MKIIDSLTQHLLDCGMVKVLDAAELVVNKLK